MKRRLYLGIESSCDETGAAIVGDGRHLFSNEIASSLDLHAEFGGVVPEIAARAHLDAILPLIETALSKAEVSFADLDGIAVTVGPGLIGSLLVGVSAAKALASVLRIPLIPVHHLAGHIAANYLVDPELEPPFLALVVSGGHSHLVHVRDYTDFKLLARTRDDAPGEVYDKIAREMGLSYPGGAKLDRLAQTGEPGIVFPKVTFKDSLDFSFSGLKTAVLNCLNQTRQKAERAGVHWTSLLPAEDLAASFQKTLADTLYSHTEQALEQVDVPSLVLAGGVAANSAVRTAMARLAEKHGLHFSMPTLPLCGDQAAMIAAQAYYEARAGHSADSRLNARAIMELCHG